ncbi:MAG: hypothetical protein E7219_06715 [Clostridiales bacterium]|nr:hypothetical protein [Clostridiales bacterium]
MKKGKRLLVVLLATLVLVTGAVSAVYAEAPYDIVHHRASHGPASVTVNDGSLDINCDYSSSDHYCELKKAKIELSAETVIYDGAAHPASVTYKNDGTNCTKFTSVNVGTIHYKGTTAAGTEYDSDSAPIDAGSYVATVSVTITDEAGGPYTVRKSFKINPRAVSASWKTSSATDASTTLEYTYDGNSHVPYAYFANDVIKSRGSAKDDVTLTVDQSQAQTKAGNNYPVVATVSGAQKDNYTVSGLKTTFKINPATATISEIKWSPSSLTHVYDGENWAPTAKGKIENTEKWIDLKVVVIDGQAHELTTYKDAGVYTAKATESKDPDYNSVQFVQGLNQRASYTITPCPVSIKWTYESQYVYNGQPQEPTATVEGVVEGETVAPKVTIDVTNKTTKMTVAKEGEYAVGDIKSIHAGDYKARVVKTGLNQEGLVDTNAGLLVNGAASTNYKLVDDSVSALYTIKQKLVDIDWYRPNVDKYGNLITTEGTEPVVKVEDNSTPLNLVYNGQQQAPTAQLKEKELITDSVAEGGAAKADVCTVSVQGPTAAVKVGRYDVQKIGLSNNDYDCLEKGRSYNIVPRPVKLAWDHYQDIYNGKEQGTTVTITNPQYRDTVTAETQYPATDVDKQIVRKHFGADGTDGDETDPVTSLTDEEKKTAVTDAQKNNAAGSNIADNRTPVDAGLYTIIPGELSDPDNYTYHTLLIENAADSVLNPEDYVDLYKTSYMIHQYVIKNIEWSKTTTTYNASYQIPTAVVADKQGPDTDEQVKLVLEDQEMQYRENNYEGEVNAGNYEVFIGTYQTGKTGERAMNYLIDGTKARKPDSTVTPKDGYGVHIFVINKRPLQVIANNKTIWYKDAPTNAGVTYKGLINGNPNDKDDLGGGTPGYYFKNPVEKTDKTDVILGSLKYTYSYAKNGKPGTYKIYVSGITSDNYDIQPVAGNLTVLDKYSYLNAKGTKKGKRGILVSWNGITGVASYDVYMSLCNTKKKVYTPVYVGSTSGTSLKVTKIGKKKLKAKKAYKYYVVAKNASGAAIAQSDLGHFITNNVKGKKVNAKSMAVNTHVVSIGKGGTAGLSASYTKAKKGKKYKLLDAWHSPLTRYATENPAVATVDANGTVYGVGKGWTRVYVIGVSGMWETVEVYVN